MIRIASGEVLKFKQKDLQVRGSAIETRIYAEDPYRDFMPSIGRVSKYCAPDHLDFIRIDTGIEEGSDVSIFYDPMIAKLIAYGEDREQSIDRMLLALDQFHISGVSHNINFLSSIMQKKKYREGNTTTNFIQEQFPDGFQGEVASENEMLIVASVLACIHQNNIERYQTVLTNETKQSSWSISFNKKKIDLMIKKSSKTTEILIDSSVLIVDLASTPNNPIVKARVDDDIYYFQIENLHPGYRLTYRGRVLEALVTRNRTAELNQLMPEKIAPDLSKFLLSPMPGLLVKICVKEGQHVKVGEELAIVEAMKMENSLRAIDDVKIKSILTKEGDNLMVDQTILEFED
jgi:propionyl-CoA carboxylase alpha chain